MSFDLEEIRKLLKLSLPHDDIDSFPPEFFTAFETAVPSEAMETFLQELNAASSETDQYVAYSTKLFSMVLTLTPGDFEKLRQYETNLQEDVARNLEKMVVEIWQKMETDLKRDTKGLMEEFKIYYNMRRAEDKQLTFDVLYSEKQRQVRDLKAKFERKRKENKNIRSCYMCLGRAKAVCCIKRAYCSLKCQQEDWDTHKWSCCRIDKPTVLVNEDSQEYC